MLTKAEHAHNAAINSRLWPPSPFTLRSIRFLLFVFAFLISRMDIYDQEGGQVEVGLVVTRCLDRAGFPDLDLLVLPPPPPPNPRDSSQFNQTGLGEILSAGET